jgi:hypothetical protein
LGKGVLAADSQIGRLICESVAEKTIGVLYLGIMKKMILFLCLAVACVSAESQTTPPPFRKEIDAFKKRDSLEKPAPNSILFTGSSSFTKWTDVKDYYPGYPIVNRAFGGSQLVDMIRYVDEAVISYRPKQIVIYCGENDVAASDTVTAQMVLQRFQTLFSLIRKKLPKVQIAFVSLKPSPSRWKLEPIYVEANKLIKEFIAKQTNTTFINIHNAMLKPDGSVMTDIFLSDNLHMNAEGYKIWQPIILPYLLK